jgi:NTP pyrophosphatase (non-canonical NTP hydrolase)
MGTVREMQLACFENAKQLGWNEKEIPIPEMIALIHSEASEALESYRNNEPISWTNTMKPDGLGKPEGIASEFADIIIRIGHYATKLGIDLDTEINRKLEYNLTRGHRHGGKLI